MVKVEQVGRRHYLRGDTYGIKDQLRAAGAHWDPDAKAWWTAKADVAARFTSGAAAASAAQPEGISQDARVVVGRALYEGRTYYVLFAGQTSRGYGVRLAFRDGSRTFWAKRPEAVQVIRTYQEPTSIGALAAYAERAKEREARGEGAPVSGCSDCRRLGRMCRQCSFDEYDN